MNARGLWRHPGELPCPLSRSASRPAFTIEGPEVGPLSGLPEGRSRLAKDASACIHPAAPRRLRVRPGDWGVDPGSAEIEFVWSVSSRSEFVSMGIEQDGRRSPRSPCASPDDAVEAFRRDIHEHYARLLRLDAYALLGVQRTSSPAEVRAAYVQALLDFDPSHHAARLTDGEAATLRTLIARVEKAYHQIQREHRPTGMEQDESPLGGAAHHAPHESTEDLLDEQFASGDAAFRAGRFDEARDWYALCVLTDPDQAEHHTALGLANVRLCNDRLAETCYQKALKLDPENLGALMGLGHLWKARGNASLAMQHYGKVRELVPEHHEANREIKLHLRRKKRGKSDSTALKLSQLLRKRD